MSGSINCNYPLTSKEFEKWKKGIEDAYKTIQRTAQECATNNSGECEINEWNKWDEEIITTVNTFNNYLSSTTPNFQRLDWLLVKAILWTESGGGNKAWDSRPMQFGNIGDAGKDDLFSTKEQNQKDYELIVPKNYRTDLDTGAHNIHQGVAYLFKKLANFDYKIILDPNDTATYFITVEKGDTLDKIAKANNTHTEILKEMNPKVKANSLTIGKTLMYKKGARKRVITGWKDISTMSIAKYYNGNRNPAYCAKLNYVLQFLRK